MTTVFETTPPTSAYLIAFHVSDFPHVSRDSNGTVLQRVFARSTEMNLTNLVLSTGELVLDALNDFLGVEYPLPKLDHVAVPG